MMSQEVYSSVDTLEAAENHSLHIIMFYHSVVSDWNNGNAHFLRGVARELTQLGHHVVVYEPRHAWSIQNMQAELPGDVEADFQRAFPEITYIRYNPELLQLDEVLATADVVIVHEWNEHQLVAEIGRHHRENPAYTLLFHDTHHRSVTDPEAMQAYDLTSYDGVLAFGNVVRDLYLSKGWARTAWTWHEAADTQLFYPREASEDRGELLWIGNWGDEERTQELHDYLFKPVAEMSLNCSVFGVRYPSEAIKVLNHAGIHYGGYLQNYKVPEMTARFKAMIHIPRRPYVKALPGIPTIRPFEAMACGIPLVSTWWNDAEEMFIEGKDYLSARTPEQMRKILRDVLNDASLALALRSHALETIRSRHTCAHRVQELMNILDEIKPSKRTATYAL